MAHADAGKTTITEQFLFLGGQTKQPGNVDKGTAQTDFLPVEQERGISVHSANISFLWNNTLINLIDTPGHVDFSADAERIMRVPGGVILVISAVEGVQAHTETLCAALRERRIPVLFFINQTDRVGADTGSILLVIEKELKITPLCLQEISDEGGNKVSISELWCREHMQYHLVEYVVSSDERLLNQYLEGTANSFSELDSQMSRLINSAAVYPLFFD